MLSARLRRLFPHDAHAGADGSYRVTSLYFDTPYDAALREKLDGMDRREKFRLRYYGENPAWLKLEKKFKVNGLCGKRTARLAREEAERLLAGEHGLPACSGRSRCWPELYSKLRGSGLAPRTVVCYDREAFSVRPRQCPHHPGPEHPHRSRCRWISSARRSGSPRNRWTSLTVLEVKYDAFLPDLVRTGRPDPGPPGRSLLQIRPVPPV